MRGDAAGWPGKELRERHADMWKEVLGRGNSKCKCPEAGEHLTHRRSKEADVADLRKPREETAEEREAWAAPRGRARGGIL